jgi:hypothetical protein
LDGLAQRYGVLPSYLLAHGDSLDVLVATTAIEYQEWRQDKKSKGQKPVNIPQEELLRRLQSVREQNAAGR